MLNQEQIISDFYVRHRKELIAFVAKSISDSLLAEDIVQDIFLKLLQTDKMITEITLPALVYKIARNLIFDYQRRKYHKLEYIKAVKNFNSTEREDQFVYSISDVTEFFERGVVTLLTIKQQQVYLMNVVDGMKISNIADTLGENYKTVEQRLGQARKKMREYMKQMLA